MKIEDYLENLNDDNRYTFYYLLGKMGVNDEDIEIVKENVNKVKTKIDFLQEQILEVERNIIKELEGEYAQNGLENTIGDYIMYKLRGYFFIKNELENKLQYEIEEGQYEEG